ncbi:hypothetical protein [Blastomonas sp. SL216]|uniref:hypothetical protein n=1 Tax=Blastomonas sp. SL216 TaxID=2995169 RepID=UPI002377BFD1|nr:hypothetical protein OU999_05610 [Blastomonas sp. SL216]
MSGFSKCYKAMLLAAATCGAALPLSAQQADPNPGVSAAEIEVIGRRQTEAEVRAEAFDYVRRSGVIKGDSPIARWHSPVCPKLIGIKPEYAQIVERKFRAIAAIAEVELADRKCDANVVIAFTTSGADVAKEIVKHSPLQIQEIPLPQRREFLEGTAPVRWWYSTQLATSEGMITGLDGLMVADYGSSEGGGSVVSDEYPMVRVYHSSLIRTQVIRVLRSATIIVDVNRATGESLDAVAAFTAMVGLAEIQPITMTPPNSILGLFDPDAKIGSATEWDISFLKALYAIPPARFGWKQKKMLANRIVRAADAAGQIIDE